MAERLRSHEPGVVTPDQLQVMARVLADPNPIHVDRKAVAAMGLGDRLINQGPTNLGYVIDMLRKNFPAHRIREISARFLANVLEGDAPIAEGCVLSRTTSEVVCHVWLQVPGRGNVLDGQATLIPR